MLMLVCLLAAQIGLPPAQMLPDEPDAIPALPECESCARCEQASEPVCEGEDGVCYLSKQPTARTPSSDCSCCDDSGLTDEPPLLPELSGTVSTPRAE